MVARGTGVPKDLAQAREWFQKAADQGDLEAQVNLAQMFSLGQGGPKDLVASYQWFTLALKRHRLDKAKLEELRDDLEWLEKRMTGAQVAEAKKKAAVWEKDHALPSNDEDPSL
jgi:TPR repeat protein